MSSPVSDALPDGVIPIENGQYLYSCPRCHKATIRIPVKQLITKAILSHEAVCPSLAAPVRPVVITSTPDGVMDIVNGGVALALDAQSKPPVTTIVPVPTPTQLPKLPTSNPNVIAPAITAPPPQIYECPECLMQFPTKALLDEHWDFAHRVRSNKETQAALDSWEVDLKNQLIKDYGYTEGMAKYTTYLQNQSTLRTILISALAVGAGAAAGTMLSSAGVTTQTAQKYYNQAQKYVPNEYKKYTQYGSAILSGSSSYKNKYKNYGSSYKKSYKNKYKNYGSSYKNKYKNYGSSYKKSYRGYW